MKISLTNKLLSLVRGDGLKIQLVRGALGVGVLKLLWLPLTLTASILLARGLGPEGYGHYAFVMAVISLLALPVGPGLGELVTREVSKYHHGADWGLFRGLLRRAHQWVVLASAAMAALIAVPAVLNGRWAMDDRWTLLLIASAMLPLLGLNALRASTLRGLRNVLYAQIPELLIRPGLHLFIAGALLLAGLLNSATALLSQILAAASAFLYGAWVLSRLRPPETRSAAPSYRDGEWARALLPFTLLAAVSTLNAQIGILALGWLGSASDVAAMQVAQNGAALVAMPLAIVNSVIAPHITRAHREGDKARLQRLSQLSARAALAVALPVALPLMFLGEPIVHFIYGEAYGHVVALPLAILVVGQIVNVAFGSVGMFLIMTGYERDTLLGQVIGLVVSFTVALALTPPLGAVGAALGVSIGLIVWNIVMAARVVKRLNLRPSAV